MAISLENSKRSEQHQQDMAHCCGRITITQVINSSGSLPFLSLTTDHNETLVQLCATQCFFFLLLLETFICTSLLGDVKMGHL
jgi:hypothetical protein